VRIGNIGTAVADSVGVTISATLGGTTSRVTTLSVGRLPPGASATVGTLVTAPTTAGTYTYIATATTPNPEVSTANNTSTATLTVSSLALSTTSPTPIADIVPTALTLGTPSIVAGGTTPLTLAVSNRGTATAQSVAVTIALGTGDAASQVASVNVGTLSAGASGTVATTLTAPMAAGTHTVTATATTPDPEASTSNNTATTSLTVSTSTVIAASPSSFIEKLTMQMLALNGYCGGPTGIHSSGPAASTTAFYTIYMTNSGGCGTGAHTHLAMQYDYTTGLLTVSPPLGSKDPSCCDGHDAPSIFRDPTTGRLWAFYGAISAGSGQYGPFYRVSTSPDDITAWDAEQRAPALGSLSEITGGFDSAGNLLLCGQLQWGSSEGRSFALRCLRRSAGGTWASKLVVETTNNGTQGSSGDPGCAPRVTVFEDGTAFLLFTRSLNGCAGAFSDLYLLKTTDMGLTWSDVAGGNKFTPTSSTGLTATWTGSEHIYPAAYQVYAGAIRLGYDSGRLSDGTPVVVYATSGPMIHFRKYMTGVWSVPFAINNAFGPALAVTSSDKILIYGTNASSMKEWISIDGGTTFPVVSTLRAPTGETINFQPNVRQFSSLAGKERVIATWRQNVADGDSTNAVAIDRPQ
jgi:hypothetical protein